RTRAAGGLVPAAGTVRPVLHRVAARQPGRRPARRGPADARAVHGGHRAAERGAGARGRPGTGGRSAAGVPRRPSDHRRVPGGGGGPPRRPAAARAGPTGHYRGVPWTSTLTWARASAPGGWPTTTACWTS